jgi:hypothetical protein
MKTYIVKIDGQFYCGEGGDHKTQIPPVAKGFHQMTNYGTSGIRLSRVHKDARRIQSVRNLMSHLNKILRCVEPAKLVIVEVCAPSRGC